MSKTTRNKKTSSRGLFSAFVAIVVATAIIVNRGYHTVIVSYAWDAYDNLTFQASSDVEEIITDLDLTNIGKYIINGARPEIDDRDSFNDNCESYNADISTLGCYVSRHIYIYNIDSDELDGIMESTAAHEFLHAVWTHLSASKKTELAAELTDFYKNSDQHDELSEELESYDEESLIDELHSRIGTEIADLPDVLEEHYAKYFNDQDKIVEFYNSYREPFEELDAEYEKLLDEMQELKKEIDTKNSKYETSSAELSRDIDEFNSCANTPNCFESDYEFQLSRNKLVSRQNALESLYNELSDLISTYNEKVKTYNSNILRGRQLDSAINSNSPPSEEEVDINNS